jgi:flagellar hook-length control protein FliK
LPTPTGDPGAADDGDPNARLNAARLSRGLAAAVQQRGGGVTLRLTPAELGTVRVQLQMQGASVQAQLHTQTDQARAMLQTQLTQLRASLESQGLTVDRLSVHTTSGPGQSNSSQAQNQSQQQAGQQFAGQQQDANHDGRSQGRFFHQQQGGGQQTNDRREDRPASFDEHLAEPEEAASPV